MSTSRFHTKAKKMQQECTETFCLRVQQATGHADPLCPHCRGTGKVTDEAPTSVGEQLTKVVFSAQAGD